MARTVRSNPTFPSSRRGALKLLAGAGVAAAVFGRALDALAQQTGGTVTGKMIRQAEWISGLEFTEDERELMLEDVGDVIASYRRLREVELDNSVMPALHFRPAGDDEGIGTATGRSASWSESAAPLRPTGDDDVAFAPVRELSAMIRSRSISSVELTRLYLDRLKTYDPVLRCVITLTEELALRQAAHADRELAAGRYRGPLHGIPWGAKDLLAVPGYPTTWGAMPYKGQTLDSLSTVAARLELAGAVLVAKLSLGALAWGDVWYDGMTRNPWNTKQGSSGSSAGPASATAAGLVGFAIGSETWGSIVSPCTRCGVTGLRPTFGSVSRHGAMALSWSMDKIGPMARDVEDCAIVFDVIRGADGLDPSAVNRPFTWPQPRDVRGMEVGYAESLFEGDPAEGVDDAAMRERLVAGRQRDRETLDVLRELGVKLKPFELPDEYPVDDLAFVLTAEATCAFDHLTRSGGDDLLVRQIRNAWPNVFRQGQLIPAVEYLRANRIRTLLMAALEQQLAGLDAYVAPSFGGSNLLLTNLTGHPCVVLPNGFHQDGTPGSISFVGRLHGEGPLLALGQAYQQATGYHLLRPPLETADE